MGHLYEQGNPRDLRQRMRGKSRQRLVTQRGKKIPVASISGVIAARMFSDCIVKVLITPVRI